MMLALQDFNTLVNGAMMSLQVQDINGVSKITKRSLPEIYNFSEYYKEKHKLEPDLQIEKEKSTNETYDFNTPKKILIPFLGSTLLTIGAYTTNLLDKFEGSIKQFIRSTLLVVSLCLGSIATISFLKEPNNKEFNLSYSDQDYF